MIRTKNVIEDLAIFGGNPAFKEKVHVGRPNIGNKEKFYELINDMIDRRWLTNKGPYVQALEERIADYIGVKNCIAMCNGTIALEIAIRACDLKGEVIVPSFTFIATAHALQWQEITPVFCDIDPNTYNINTSKIEELITPRTTGIIAVHLWGRPCNIEKLIEIAEKHNLKLIFDAAHAFGCTYSSKMIGNFGEAEVFSFHATKFFNTLEGGAVVTHNDQLAEKIRLMNNFGFAGKDKVIYIGTNGKMNEASAAMGLNMFDVIDDLITVNYKNYNKYKKELKGINGINLTEFYEKEQCNYHYIVIEIDESHTLVSRDQLQKILIAENVLARRYFYPGCHMMEPYRSYFPHAGLLLPETEKLSKKVLSLPTGTGISTEQIIKICNLIMFSIQNAEEIQSRLNRINPEYSELPN